MKKLLEFGFEIFLFLFLLLILAVPFLVSFNLDPQLYIPQHSKVAGVSDTVNKELHTFTIKEKYGSSQRIFVTRSEQIKNKFELEFKIAAGGNLNDTYSLGSIINEGEKPITCAVQLLGNKKIVKGSSISFIVGDEESLLFDRTEFQEKTFVLNPHDEKEIELSFLSSFGINFPSDMKLIIYTLNGS